MKIVLRGPGPFKSTPDPKTVCYSPRERPEMAEITSFLRICETCVTRSPKPCAIAHENCEKWPKSRVFYDFVELVLQSPGPFKFSPDPKTVCYTPRKRPEMAEITSFFTILCKSCYGVSDRLNPPRTAKPCAIAHENGQKWRKSRVFYEFVKLVLRGPGPFKFTPDPKTVCYSPRKLREMAEITSFIRFYESCVSGSRNV